MHGPAPDCLVFVLGSRRWASEQRIQEKCLCWDPMLGFPQAGVNLLGKNIFRWDPKRKSLRLWVKSSSHHCTMGAIPYVEHR